jgi:signal peptidase II
MRWPFLTGLSVALIALDQLVKWLVETRLPFQEMVDFIPFISLYRTWNQGIAFSMLWGLNDLALIAVTLVITGFVIWLASRTPVEKTAARLGFAMIVAGAIGNLIDRSLFGHVVDYILFHTANWSFAVFNLADSFISVGAALIILQELIDWLSSRAAQRGPKPD